MPRYVQQAQHVQQVIPNQLRQSVNHPPPYLNQQQQSSGYYPAPVNRYPIQQTRSH